MKAPVAQDASWYDTLGAKGATERGFEGGAHAYNEATMLAASSNVDGTTAPVRKVVTSGITKVGLRNADIRVQKVWEDAKNQDGLRPDSLKVALVADGKNAVKTLDLDANGEWSGLFEDVQRVNEQGSQIEYSVDEGSVKGTNAACAGCLAILRLIQRRAQLPMFMSPRRLTLSAPKSGLETRAWRSCVLHPSGLNW